LRGLSEKQVTRLSEDLCPVCNSKELRVFFEILDVPVSCNILWRSREAARNCPRGNIKLAFCPVCSFIMNLEFESSRLEYTQAYGNPLHFSPYFQDYAQSLAERLVEQHNLHNKDIIEIGCGDGYFLQLLCQVGNNRGVGFDPAYVEQEKHGASRDRVKFVHDFYSERYRDYQSDLIVCRQTLEHIHNPKGFLKTLRRAIGNRVDTHVFFEVPNATQIFRRLFVWDIIYEHCSYFTSLSLARTLSSSGFRVCELTEEFEGQFLCVHARPGDQGAPHPDQEHPGEVNRVASDIASFAANYQSKVEKCRYKLEQVECRGQLAVVWGAGSKGVSFLNALKELQIEFVVDINPRKQGMYIPGTGQQIVRPEFLRDYQPDVIVVMNPIYRREIRQLTKKLGLTAKLIPA
jgi:2-polyprenyl-3-methyl-5-hydroxy-6-metoxy-1,4-benzoquinol methylase